MLSFLWLWSSTMSTQFSETIVCIEFLLNVNGTLSRPKRKWRSACAKIYCCRTLLSLAKNATVRINTKLEPEIFQISLTKLVKEKNLQQLLNFGGTRVVASALKANFDGGICGSDEDRAHRRNVFGSNTYEEPPIKSFFSFVAEASKSLKILIFLGCAAVSLALGIKDFGLKEGWQDGGSIFLAVFIYIVVSALCNYRQTRKLDKLFSKVRDSIQTEVVRSGRRQEISILEAVVGDVIYLKVGDQVPADGLFLDGHSLQVEQSSITGEYEYVEVNKNQNPFLFSGTKVVDGYGRMIATSVGMNTTWGQMMSQISRQTSEQIPFKPHVEKIMSLVDIVGGAIAILVFIFLLFRYFTGNTTDSDGSMQFVVGQTPVHDVVIAVVNLMFPDSLPLAVTVSIAYSMKKMIVDHVMVRKLSACETMNRVTVICTNKTGTLTQNKMKVVKFWLGQEPITEGCASLIYPPVIDLIQQGIALNTAGAGYWETLGSEFEFSSSNPTEKAIFSWAAQELHMDMEETKQSCIVLQLEAFDSQKKCCGVLMRKKTDNSIHIHWKGAAEIILAFCSSYYDADGNMKYLDVVEKEKLEQIIQGIADSRLRCIAFAHKQVPEEEHEDVEDQEKLNQHSLTLLGVVGIQDPCHPGIKQAVEDCQHAGVNIKMITGDNIFTAKAVASECGILGPNLQDMSTGAVVEGEEFRNYTPQQRMEKIDQICVMARSSPSDKLLMVQCLKQKGHVVAVTGDGTKDAPALKEADIGLSMGIQGTEVVKQSSDIVIMDDKFASIATVLRWGRCVYTNIQKFIQFQLTVIVAALVVNFLPAFVVSKTPFTAVQLLWVSLIVNTLGALALVTEHPAKELMEKPPVSRTQPLITNVMLRNLFAQAFYQIVILLILQFRGEPLFGLNENVKDTLTFNIFVLCQVFNEFNTRKLEKKNVFQGIHRNKLFLGIVGITIVLQIMILEYLKRFGDGERLNWGQWGACIGIAAASWPISWIVKCIPVPKKSFF